MLQVLSSDISLCCTWHMWNLWFYHNNLLHHKHDVNRLPWYWHICFSGVISWENLKQWPKKWITIKAKISFTNLILLLIPLVVCWHYFSTSHITLLRSYVMMPNLKHEYHQTFNWDSYIVISGSSSITWRATTCLIERIIIMTSGQNLWPTRARLNISSLHWEAMTLISLTIVPGVCVGLWLKCSYTGIVWKVNWIWSLMI